MSTENDLQKLSQSDSFNPIVSQKEILEKKIQDKTKPVFNIKQWISTYRSTTRIKFGRKFLNFSTVLACLPVAVGFLDFLKLQISSPRQYESLFQKSLPIFANLQPKLTYETFHYIIGTNFEVNSNKTGFFLGRPQFIGTFNRSNLEKSFLTQQKNSVNEKQFNLNSFSGLSGSFYSISSGCFNSSGKRTLFPSPTKILDELPGYVQGLGSRRSKSSQNVPNSLLKSKQKQLFQTSFSSSLESNKLRKNSLLIPSNFLSKSSFLSQKPCFWDRRLRLLQKSQIYSLSTPFSLKKGFHSQHNDFYNNLTQLDKEFQKLFIKKQISLSFNDVLGQSEAEIQKDLPFLKIFLENNSHIDDEVLIDMLLRNLDKKTISKESNAFRLMSGYQYPDTTTSELSRFYKQRDVFQYLFSKKESLKNFLNFSLDSSLEKQKGKQIVLGTRQYDFKIEKLPSFAVQTQEILVKSSETGESLYQGPNLVLDSENAFDWITRGNLRSWFSTYLSPLNPFSQKPENFFGLYDSPVSSKQKSALDAFQDRSLFYPSFINQIKRSALVATPLQSDFLPFRSSFFVAPDSESSVNNFVRGIDTSLTETNQEDLSSATEFLPLIQTKQPSFKVSSRKTTDFQGYSSVFDVGLTGKSDYIYSLDLVTETASTIHYSSGQYKKIPSIFSKSSPNRGVANWEPLTANSWLVISQLSFALFIFQILKNLADNYGRELLGYLLDLVAALGFLDESLKQEIELLMGRRDKGFRVIPQSSKTFNDIVGVQKFLPELYEVIWYLRNSARDFTLSGALPRGVLLTGPPGTGKTLLVQALAGEAHVPVIVLSGSSLIEPGEIASTKLELVFQEARQIAPCVVFIDEIDTLAPKRSGVVQNPMAHDDIVDFLNSFEQFNPESTLERLEAEVQESEAESQGKLSNQDSSQQLSLLTQLLIELDGIRGRDGVLVIGATNRLDILDPALLRPGRFDQIIEVGLPNKQKRIDILKFYGEKLGYQPNIPWNYLGERTVGFSAADLATLMNESALKAILNQKETIHTLQTIEHGIDRLTTSETEKPTILKGSPKANLSVDSKLSLLRFAYYQAGKIVVSSVLKDHPKSVFAVLWPRCPNIRSLEITTNLQTTVFEFARLSEINDRLVGCYAGKAAEFLFLEKFASYRSSQRSTLGLEDLLFGQTLAYALLEKFLFYSKKSYNQQTIGIPENINELEFPEMLEKLALYEEIVDTIEYPPFEKALEEDTSSLTEKLTIYDDWEPQSNYFVPWWQQEASDALEFGERNFHNWTRIYLENPERSYRNVEWRPYDEFYHTDTAIKNVKAAFANFSKENIEVSDYPKNFVFGNDISTDKKQQTQAELISEIDVSKETSVSQPSITEVQNTLNTRNFAKEIQNLEVENESETENSTKNEVSGTGEEVSSSETLQKEFQSQYFSQEVKIPWRNQDKTQTLYPTQNVYIPWSDVSNLTRDYPIHSLILQSFNKALVILNQNRELVDRFVVDLLSEEILRQHEIEAVLQEFQQFPMTNEREKVSDPLEKSKEFQVVETDWGQYSRKPRPRWIDFAQFSKQTT